MVPHGRLHERDPGRRGDRAAHRGRRRDLAAQPIAGDARTAGRGSPQLAAQHPGRVADPHASGSAPTSITARELALKIEEGARIPATALQLETLLHGHLAGCDAGTTALVLFAADPRPERAARRAAARRRRRGARDRHPGRRDRRRGRARGLPDAVGRWRCRPRRRRVAGALLTGAVALQLLTLELAHLAGAIPDLIRREQRPYREAAAVGREPQPTGSRLSLRTDGGRIWPRRVEGDVAILHEVRGRRHRDGERAQRARSSVTVYQAGVVGSNIEKRTTARPPRRPPPSSVTS